MTPRTEGPWWIAAIYKLGVTSAIAAFLIWWLTSQVSANLASIQQRLDQHVTSTDIYLHAICVNTAKTEVERASCPTPRH